MTEEVSTFENEAEPWYKVGLIRFFLALFAVLLIATAVTIYLAGNDFDGVVATEYVKRDLSILASTTKQEKAASMHLNATLRLDWNSRGISVKIVPDPHEKYLNLRIIHPTRESKDQNLVLVLHPDGTYQAKLQSLEMKHGYFQLEDQSGKWQLVGEFRFTLDHQDQQETRSWTLTH